MMMGTLALPRQSKWADIECKSSVVDSSLPIQLKEFSTIVPLQLNRMT